MKFTVVCGSNDNHMEGDAPGRARNGKNGIPSIIVNDCKNGTSKSQKWQTRSEKSKSKVDL